MSKTTRWHGRPSAGNCPHPDPEQARSPTWPVLRRHAAAHRDRGRWPRTATAACRRADDRRWTSPCRRGSCGCSTGRRSAPGGHRHYADLGVMSATARRLCVMRAACQQAPRRSCSEPAASVQRGCSTRCTPRPAEAASPDAAVRRRSGRRPPHAVPSAPPVRPALVRFARPEPLPVATVRSLPARSAASSVMGDGVRSDSVKSDGS